QQLQLDGVQGAHCHRRLPLIRRPALGNCCAASEFSGFSRSLFHSRRRLFRRLNSTHLYSSPATPSAVLQPTKRANNNNNTDTDTEVLSLSHSAAVCSLDVVQFRGRHRVRERATAAAVGK